MRGHVRRVRRDQLVHLLSVVVKKLDGRVVGDAGGLGDGGVVRGCDDAAAARRLVREDEQWVDRCRVDESVEREGFKVGRAARAEGSDIQQVGRARAVIGRKAWRQHSEVGARGSTGRIPSASPLRIEQQRDQKGSEGIRKDREGIGKNQKDTYPSQ